MSNDRSETDFVRSFASQLRQASTLSDKGSLFYEWDNLTSLREHPWSEHQEAGIPDLLLDLVSSEAFRALSTPQEMVCLLFALPGTEMLTFTK